jgi:hypothetical protein
VDAARAVPIARRVILVLGIGAPHISDPSQSDDAQAAQPIGRIDDRRPGILDEHAVLQQPLNEVAAWP